MKLKYCVFAIACAMALSLTGCFAGRDDNGNSAPVEPTHSVPSDYGSYPPSAGMDDIRNSAGVGSGNDAMQGGGAGGTNDQNNDGLPDGTSNPNHTNDVGDSIGDAAGDLARGAGNAVRDAGNAIGDAANDVGRAMR